MISGTPQNQSFTRGLRFALFRDVGIVCVSNIYCWIWPYMCPTIATRSMVRYTLDSVGHVNMADITLTIILVCYVQIKSIWIIDSLSPSTRGSNYKIVMSEHMLKIRLMSTSSEFALRWMPQNTFDCKSSLTRVIVWWCQERSRSWAHVDPNFVPMRIN